MRVLNLQPQGRRRLRVLCLGAHADDIEIGCGGLVLSLLRRRRRPLEVTWVVFSAGATRGREAQRSARRFLYGAARADVQVHGFRDGFFPYEGAAIKEAFERLKREAPAPDLILSHYGNDRHQDHRIISELTWNTFRDHLILEYEIPKYDGDLGAVNCFVPVSQAICRRKLAYLQAGFASQRVKHWFSPETFGGLMRLRGVECRAPDGYAEGFYARKLALGWI